MCDYKGVVCIPGVQCITRKIINILCDQIMILCTIALLSQDLIKKELTKTSYSYL